MNTITIAAPSDAAALAKLADEIWKEHYYPITGKAHVDYLLKTLQSEAVILDEIVSGRSIYFWMLLDGQRVGYCAICVRERSLYLSKLYVKKDARQHGLSRMMLDYIIANYGEGKAYIHLNVNKHNDNSIAAYKRLGFVVTDALERDVGGGHVMDDFELRLELK